MKGQKGKIHVANAPVTIKRLNGSGLNLSCFKDLPPFGTDAVSDRNYLLNVKNFICFAPDKSCQGQVAQGRCIPKNKTVNGWIPVEEANNSSNEKRGNDYRSNNAQVTEEEEKQFSNLFKKIFSAETFEELYHVMEMVAAWSYERFKNEVQKNPDNPPKIPDLNVDQVEKASELIFGPSDIPDVLMDPQDPQFFTKYKGLATVLGYATQFTGRRYPYWLCHLIRYKLHMIGALSDNKKCLQFTSIFDSYLAQYSAGDAVSMEDGHTYEIALTAAILFRTTPFLATIENGCSATTWKFRLQKTIDFMTSPLLGAWDEVSQYTEVFRVKVVPVLKALLSKIPIDKNILSSVQLAKVISSAFIQIGAEHGVILTCQDMKFPHLKGVKELRFEPVHSNNLLDTDYGKMLRPGAEMKLQVTKSLEISHKTKEAICETVKYLKEFSPFLSLWDQDAKKDSPIPPVLSLKPPTIAVGMDNSTEEKKIPVHFTEAVKQPPARKVQNYPHPKCSIKGCKGNVCKKHVKSCKKKTCVTCLLAGTPRESS